MLSFDTYNYLVHYFGQPQGSMADDVVFGTVDKAVDVPEASAHLFPRPEFARNTQGIAEHHAGKSAGNMIEGCSRHYV